MSDAAVKVLLENLKELMSKELRDINISRKKDELQSLMDEIRVLTVYNRHWILQAGKLFRELDLDRQIKEMVYEMEDAITSWSVRMAEAKEGDVCLGPALVVNLAKSLGEEIKSIRSGKLEPITRRIQAYKDLVNKQANSTGTDQWYEWILSKQQNKEDHAIGPKKLVGFKDEKETLISSLMEETGKLDFIAITGMPGIGKTTLALEIYRDQRIRDAFPTRIWVHGDFLSRKELDLNILYDLYMAKGFSISFETLNDLSRLNVYELEEKITDNLRPQKYLLVMDGLWDWNVHFLNEIKYELPKMGKVLITSHNNHIARTPPHVLRFLNETESWELLHWEVFEEPTECSQTIKETGECIARNCDGLPLAIAVVGSSLMVPSSNKDAEDLTMEWWKVVSQNVVMCVTDYGDQHNAIKRVDLSYTRLPQHVQECFLYLGVFPEGHEIRVQTLACLWVAEGLLHDKNISTEGLVYDERNSEDIAYEYLHFLINRNLVMVVKSYPNGDIKTCRLHKLIYAFCKYKAAELDLYQEIKMSGDHPLSLAPDCHRLCIYLPLSEFLSRKPKGRRVRSVLHLNNEDKVLLDPNHSSLILECFKLLRVLECSNANFTRFPDKLGKLIHLRYLSLSCDEISVIPKTISLLLVLETLVVHTRSSSLQVKANLWKMVQLRHFVTKAAIVLAMPGNGKAGKNLQTLTRLAPACCTEDVFTRARNLKTLGIRGNLADLSDANFWSKLELLQHLKLINDSQSMPHCVIAPNCFPSTLKRLTLSGTQLKWEYMSIIGKIDGLEILKLKNNAFIGESWSSSDTDGFGRLRFLLVATTDVESWEASPNCFPSLECLVLKNCAKLQKVPSALAKSLVTLHEDNTLSESARESAREIKQEIARRQGQKKM